MTRGTARLHPRTPHTAAGFTLLELLTALAVMGIAIALFLQLFTASNTLANVSRSHDIAAKVAEEYLTLVQAAPERFQWPNYADAPTGELQAVTPLEGGAIGDNFAEPPRAMPSRIRAFNRDKNLYTNFTWEVFARLPDDSAQYVEVTVEVSWTARGRLQRFSLSSALPRSVAEGIGS